MFLPWDQLDKTMTTAVTGRIVQTTGTAAAVAGFPVPVGAVASIQRRDGTTIEAEVIGFRDNLTLLYPHDGFAGVRPGDRVHLRQSSRYVRLGRGLLGRVIDGRGRPIDDGPGPYLPDRAPLNRRPPPATSRPRIDASISTGIRAIDGMLTCGRGQRVGIFSGSGVGKSVMLGMMAKHTSADVNIIALIGERSREVNEFLQRDLGQEGLAKSVVVVATSDDAALTRVESAFLATTVAEYFRDQGKDVLLIMDSITRFAMAQREVGLAAGEPPTTRGYPPSVYSVLPRLVERAGRSTAGSITAFYSVLVEGDDPNEPISDIVRGLLDGHIVLSRRLAGRGHYPSIEITQSISRLLTEITPADQQQAITRIRQLLSAYQDHEDLISIGAYRAGSNPDVDLAIAMKNEVDAFLRQSMDQGSSIETSRNALAALISKCETTKGSLPNNAILPNQNVPTAALANPETA